MMYKHERYQIRVIPDPLHPVIIDPVGYIKMRADQGHLVTEQNSRLDVLSFDSYNIKT